MTASKAQTTDPEVLIRRAELDDAITIAELLHSSFVEYRSLYTTAGFQATAGSAEQMVERMKQGPVWVALLDQTIVGTVSVVTKGKSLYIRGMAVQPSARGHRIGELLLTRIEGLAIDEGFERLFLSTTPFLVRAIRLYENFGFKRTDEGPNDLHGTPLFTMEKALRSPV
jgi:N-acetylglutamate synthase-like GNAT family acetyltransferase